MAALLLCAAAGSARAQESGDPPVSWVIENAAIARQSRAVAADASFGPVLVIEDIVVEGNESTTERLIRRALPLRAGEVLRAGDPRFQKARFKLLATGYFRSVELDLRKGSQRGNVLLIVKVTERGTVVLNSLYFGTSTSSPWWAGVDFSERNLFGTGLGLGGGLVYAATELDDQKNHIEGSDDQLAMIVRLDDSSLRGTPLGIHGAFSYSNASEPYRVSGDPNRDANAIDFRALSYTRVGFKGGISFDVTPLSVLTVDGRVEWVDASVPLASTRELPDGSLVPIDIGLEPGASRVVTVSLGFDRDTRTDPVLPVDGERFVVFGEFGATWMGGSYNAAVALTRYQHWWAIDAGQDKKHVLSVHILGGLVLGQAARFDRLHASDMNRLLTPRALGLVVSNTSSPDLLGTSTADVTYGEVGGSVVVEYSYQLFRNRRHVYGGDLFVGAGLWGLADTRDLQVRDGPLYRALPVDLMLDAGLRIDTELGIFELTFANALGRLPL